MRLFRLRVKHIAESADSGDADLMRMRERLKHRTGKRVVSQIIWRERIFEELKVALHEWKK